MTARAEGRGDAEVLRGELDREVPGDRLEGLRAVELDLEGGASAN